VKSKHTSEREKRHNSFGNTETHDEDEGYEDRKRRTL
jgi:hypothetical protein